MIPAPPPLQEKILTPGHWRLSPAIQCQRIPQIKMRWRRTLYLVQTQLWCSRAVKQLNSFAADLGHSGHSCEVTGARQARAPSPRPAALLCPLLPAAAWPPPARQLHSDPRRQLPCCSSCRENSIGLQTKSAFFEPHTLREVPVPPSWLVCPQANKHSKFSQFV